jgi:hypothetical protein
MMIRTFDRPPQVKPSKKQQELLGDLQNKPFTYFVDQINLDNGLVADSNWTNSPASIAAVGFLLACLCSWNRTCMRREEAVE